MRNNFLKLQGSSINIFLAFVFLACNVQAEEGGSGHYFPGSMSSSADGVSATEIFLLRLNVIDYDGSFGTQREVPIGGLTVLDVDVDVKAYGLTTFWRPSWGGLSEKWSYAMSATIPYVDLIVHGLIKSGSMTVPRSDTASGLGDILLFPIMLNYQASPSLNANFRLGLYAPTGDYEAGALANAGKNFWTVEPTAALIYLNPDNGREASVFFGVDFNQKNSATNYKSGSQAHIEVTLEQHLPLWGGVAGIGVSGFWYHQLSADSGEGANLGAFKARANGIGPVVSFSKKLDSKHSFVGEFKWLHEFSNSKRPEGDTFFLKAMLLF